VRGRFIEAPWLANSGHGASITVCVCVCVCVCQTGPAGVGTTVQSAYVSRGVSIVHAVHFD
jgi:hypothetical protein